MEQYYIYITYLRNRYKTCCYFAHDILPLPNLEMGADKHIFFLYNIMFIGPVLFVYFLMIYFIYFLELTYR